jgi:hypothetical protein
MGENGGLRNDTRATSLLCGPRAYKLFRFAAVWTAALLVFLVIAAAAYDGANATSGGLRLGIQIIGGCLGTIGAFAGFTIFLGMLAYLFRWDHSSSKLLWITIFLLTASFGSSLYFFIVYRKQVRMVT